MIAPIPAGAAAAAGAAGKGFLKEAGSKVLDFFSSLGLGAIGRRWNRKDYERQLADQERLIDEERAYNDFDSVMRRAAKAGVNPLHALGVGAVSGGNTTTSVPDISPSNVNPLNVGGFLDAQMKSEQIRSVRLANEYAEQTMGFRVSLQEKLVASQEISNQLQSELLNTEKLNQQQISANTAYLESEKRLKDALAATEEQLRGDRKLEIQAKIAKWLEDAKSVAIYNEHASELFEKQIASLAAAAFQAMSQGRLARIEGAFVAQDSFSRKTSAIAQRDTAKNQKEYNDAVAKLRQAEIALQGDRLNQQKLQMYIDCVQKVLAVAAGATAGFFIAGPVGAGVGAASALGVSHMNPFEVTP